MIIDSILDTDLYKLTMHQAICHLFPSAKVRYKFINRGSHQFPEGFKTRLLSEISNMTSLYLGHSHEYNFLRWSGLFNTMYLSFLSGYRFNPDEVRVNQIGGDLDITIEGYWHSVILWEVPLMAIISELYFDMTGHKLDIIAAVDKADEKCSILLRR